MADTKKTAIVTGGGSGIGRALSRQLAAQGAHVVVADIQLDSAERTVQSIASAGGSGHAMEVDVANREAVQRLVDSVVEQTGQLDLIFNNTGIAVIGEALEMSAEQWDSVLAVNLHGVVHGTTAAYAVMARQGHGHIVNIASLAGLVPMPFGTTYCATKHAVVGLSTSLRSEAAGHGVRISVACPGFIDTAIKHSPYVGIDKEKMLERTRFKFHDVDDCAATILRGVRRNKAIITVTPLATAAWLLYRTSPSLMTWLGKLSIGRLRKKLS